MFNLFCAKYTYDLNLTYCKLSKNQFTKLITLIDVDFEKLLYCAFNFQLLDIKIWTSLPLLTCLFIPQLNKLYFDIHQTQSESFQKRTSIFNFLFQFCLELMIIGRQATKGSLQQKRTKWFYTISDLKTLWKTVLYRK